MKIFGHIALSFLLLLTASGVTINMHFCQGHIYDLALNIPANSCCADDDSMCHHDQNQAKTNHCDDKTIKLKATDNFLIYSFYPDFKNYHSDNIFFESQIQIENRITTVTGLTRLNYDNKPPPTQEVILSQIQSFLI